MNAPLPPHVVDEMMRRHRGGDSTGTIARAMGLHQSTVTRKLRKLGVTLSCPIPQEKMDEAREMLECGASYTDASNVVGVSRTTLSKYLPGYGKARIPLSPEALDEIERRYDAGENTATIARAMGVHQSTIASRLRRFGVVFRPRHSQEKINQARELLEQRAGYHEAASVVGIPRQTLAGILPGYGLTPDEIVERQGLGRAYARYVKSLAGR